jgi:hypothetical protein
VGLHLQAQTALLNQYQGFQGFVPQSIAEPLEDGAQAIGCGFELQSVGHQVLIAGALQRPEAGLTQTCQGPEISLQVVDFLRQLIHGQVRLNQFNQKPHLGQWIGFPDHEVG